MKVATPNPVSTVEDGVDIRKQHNEFIQFSTREDRYRKKTTKRPVRTKRTDGINIPVMQREVILEPRITIGPEFAAFTFTLDGIPRQLLTYLMIYELDHSTGRFRFDDQVIHRFSEYSELFGKPCKEGVVRSGIRKLVDGNIVQNVTRGRYMLNPLLGVVTTEGRRRELINEYSRVLAKKGKDPTVHLYPVYNTENQQKDPVTT